MPRPKSATSRARRDEWELHRRELSRLFLVEGLPVAQIAKYMKNEHDFDKKPKDYEYRLKKWHLRRNLHETELRSIRSQLSRREQAGRQSEIIVSGIRWSESMVLGRLERHKSSYLSSKKWEVNILPDFLARVQTPSPLISDLPEWPEELPWLQFNESIHQVLATLTSTLTSTEPGRMCRPHAQEAPLFQTVRPYMTNNDSKTTGLLEVHSIHSPRKMRAMLEVIAPQAYTSDHETTANILHNGSHESVAVELVRLIIYFESNNLFDLFHDRFETLLGFKVHLADSENMMDFLRGTGFLTEANIDWLRGCADHTSQTFLNRLLVHSIVDENSVDVLGWMVPDQFEISYLIQISKQHWCEIFPSVDGFHYRRSRDYRPKATMLQFSCFTWNTSAVRLLLDLGADPYGTSVPGDRSPIELAASIPDQASATDIVALLLSKQTTSSSELQATALEGALQQAIGSAHKDLIVMLLSEGERLGHGIICSQHFTIAAKYADYATIRLLVDKAASQASELVQLPRDILFSAISVQLKRCDLAIGPSQMLERLNYLLAMGVNPGVLKCRHGCFGSFCLDVVIGSEMFRPERDVLGENCILKMIEALRKHGCPQERPAPTSGGEHRASALQMAIKLGYTRLVEYLLDWGANIDFLQDNSKSETPMSKDCQCYQDPDLCRYSTEGCSPLLTALRHKKIEIAKMLLRRKPDLKLRGGEPELAMKSGNDPELATMLLLAVYANVDEWGILFEQAISMRNPESIKMLLSMDTNGRAPIDSRTMMRAALIIGDYDKAYQQATACDYDSQVLFEAVLQSHIHKEYHTIVERLLQFRPDALNDGFEIRAVASAAVHHDAHLLDCLMKCLGQGPWIAEFPPQAMFLSDWVLKDECFRRAHVLSYAVEMNLFCKDETIVQGLLEAHVPANGMQLGDLKDLLMSVETLRQLLAAGCDPTQDFLLQAVEANMLAHVQALCEANINLNAMLESDGINVRGSRTAIQATIEAGSPEMLQMLLHYGADVDHSAGPFFGATCLQLAAGAGDIGLVRFLLSKGAKVNAKRSLIFGRTAVEIAAENGRLDVLKLLLLEEAPLFQTAAERYQFVRAVQLAEKHGHGLLAKILRQHINWNSDDQQLFDEMADYAHTPFHLDDMTQNVSKVEKRHPEFWFSVNGIFNDTGLSNIYDIDRIEEWIGREDYDSDDEADKHSEGQVSVYSSYSVTTTQRPTADDELAYVKASRVELREQVSSNLQAPMIDSVWNPRETTLAPQAIRHDDEAPTWLNMDDNRCDAADDVVMLGISEQQPVTRNLHRTSWGDVQRSHVNDLGDTTFSPINMEECFGEVDHSQRFDWGFWDEEGIGREIAELDLSSDSVK